MKFKYFTLLVITSFVLFACNNDSDKGDSEVEVTMTSNFFENMSEEEIKENAENEGFKDAEIHSDGSVTYTMSQSRHKELIEELKVSLDKSIDELSNSEDFPSIKKVKANDDYTKFDITVDKLAFESSMDMLGSLTVYIGSSYYHAFNGEAENMQLEFRYIDEETGEVFETTVLPDDLEMEETAE